MITVLRTATGSVDGIRWTRTTGFQDFAKGLLLGFEGV